VTILIDGTRDAIWAGLSRHGRPIQYAHLSGPLAMWDVWTPFAGPPAAFEPPSAGFVLDWHTQRALHARGARVVTLTHAAGLSATGDDALDARLPLPEPYVVPPSTVQAIRGARRVIAVGTTVVRALEHAASRGGLAAGAGVADQRIGPATVLRIVDVLLTGTHERGTSHYELLRAFASDAALAGASDALEARGYRTHEFGDSMLLFRQKRAGTRLAA
jgi:S-adenosylmethionine:tRNA ribosyltransferase-isomerase